MYPVVEPGTNLIIFAGILSITMKADIVLKVCRKCKAACCKLGGSDFTETEMKRVLKAGHPDFFVKIGNNHYELKTKKGSKSGICPYLTKDNACSIHKLRPLTCRCWPVYINYKDGEGEYILFVCPLTPLLSGKDIREMKKQAGMVREIIRTTLSDSKLPKSEIRLIEKRFGRFKRKNLRQTCN